MSDGRFSLRAWHAYIGAPARESSPVRQDLVRGLKEYFESVYGYDRYGAETIFQLEERLADPYIYGFALRRILHDRRLSQATRVRASRWALEHAQYGIEGGVPFGFLAGIAELGRAEQLTTTEFRYALTVSAAEQRPFRGLDRRESPAFLENLLGDTSMPEGERLFWAHSLLARHRDEPGATALVDAVLGDGRLEAALRRELCLAWLHFRQPRLAVDPPNDDGSPFGVFVARHMPFWLAHAPAWPGLAMVRRAPVWLASLGEDPIEVADAYLAYRGAFADQIHQGAADVLLEHAHAIPADLLRDAIDRGLRSGLGVSARRTLYRAGIEAFGDSYLSLARADTAGSVRSWAAKQG